MMFGLKSPSAFVRRKSTGRQRVGIGDAAELERRAALVGKGETDIDRWGRLPQGLWKNRAIQAAREIRSFSRVVDLGAGDMKLRRYLPFGCRYVAIDCVPRGMGSRVCDFNVEEVPIAAGEFDTAAALGLLEYILKPVPFLTAVRSKCDRLIVTYSSVELTPQVDRAQQGWVNGYRTDQVKSMLTEAGWALRRQALVDGTQVLLTCERVVDG